MKNNNKHNNRLFQRFSLLTLVAIYLLILVGGIVRSTGSGMGCPDWPKCFGSWVPPTDVSQLPSDYKDIYSEKRARKNERFASYLSVIGFKETAQMLLDDKSILEEADFNATKTWIEYINRLIGVIIGLLIIGTAYLALPFRKHDKGIFYSAIGALVLVIFQGWIGSIVVSTNLVPWMITIHMLIALLIVFLLINVVHLSGTSSETILKREHRNKILVVLIASMLLLTIQIVLGTQVREMVDVVAAKFNYAERENWIAELGNRFVIHRSFSWLIFLSNGLLIYMMYKQRIINKSLILLMALVLLSILTGVVMAYLGIPAFIQPAHLLLGTLALGVQFFMFLGLKEGVSTAHVKI